MTKERRIYERKWMNARVLLRSPEIGDLQTYTHDISNGGVHVLLQKKLDLPSGEILDMLLLDSEQPDTVFNMEVIRVDEQRIGLKFLGYEKNGERYPMNTLRNDLEE